jgi:hypothetical protein
MVYMTTPQPPHPPCLLCQFGVLLQLQNLEVSYDQLKEDISVMKMAQFHMLSNLMWMLHMYTETQLLKTEDIQNQITPLCTEAANLQNKSLVFYDRGFQLEVLLPHIFHRHYWSNGKD